MQCIIFIDFENFYVDISHFVMVGWKYQNVVRVSPL